MPSRPPGSLLLVAHPLPSLLFCRRRILPIHGIQPPAVFIHAPLSVLHMPQQIQHTQYRILIKPAITHQPQLIPIAAALVIRHA